MTSPPPHTSASDDDASETSPGKRRRPERTALALVVALWVGYGLLHPHTGVSAPSSQATGVATRPAPPPPTIAPLRTPRAVTPPPPPPPTVQTRRPERAAAAAPTREDILFLHDIIGGLLADDAAHTPVIALSADQCAKMRALWPEIRTQLDKNQLARSPLDRRLLDILTEAQRASLVDLVSNGKVPLPRTLDAYIPLFERRISAR